jgi:hypothetical protein
MKFLIKQGFLELLGGKKDACGNKANSYKRDYR